MTALRNEGRKRLSRRDSFVGIHYDFHARDNDRAIGKNTTAESIQHIIDAVNPDYIETDCKGHHGIVSYPTRFGNAPSDLVGDPLRVWRDVTRDNGVALYVHYSGVVDGRAARLHPEWARIDEHGKPDEHATSVFGPYVDELMIPQLIELIDEYEIDGVWVDGDCWGTAIDYSPRAIELFRQQTGLDAPRHKGDEGWQQFLAFQRTGFVDYVRHYTDVLHAHSPGFQIGSAWAFSSFLPEPVSVDVDYMSGDSSSINHSYSRMEARFFVHQGKPWDLMTWSFAGRFELDGPPPAIALKTAKQLTQEAATTIALGGGYQTVSNQRRDGSVIEWQLATLGEVAAFCREREEYCRDGRPVHHIALVHSATSYYRVASKLMNSIDDLDPLLGTLDALLDRQHPVEIVMEHSLLGHTADYPVIVVPEWAHLAAPLQRELHHYVDQGGRLLVIGAEAVQPFADILGVEVVGSQGDRNFWIESGGRLAGHHGSVLGVRVKGEARELSRLYWEHDFAEQSEVAASIAAHGAGYVAGVYFDFGAHHHATATAGAKDFLNDVLTELYPEPAVRVSGSHLVDVIVAERDGMTLVHLINTAGQQRDASAHVFDEIPTLGPIVVEYRLETEPSQVTLEPGGLVLPYTLADGVLRTTVDVLDVHRIVVLHH